MLISILIGIVLILAIVGYATYRVHVTHKLVHTSIKSGPKVVPLWPHDPGHCVCQACKRIVARFDARGVCDNCVAEGK